MEPAIRIEPPWLERFAANPTGELSAVLGGYAKIFPLERLEPSTILIEKFGDLPDADSLRAQLDGAILDLLGRFRRATPRQVERHGMALLIHQANEMFLAAGRLRLPGVLAAVGRDFAAWSAWAKRLRLADYRDARLGLWRMVARNQDLAGLGRSLAAHWINICGEVGAGRLSRAYLPVAFDGLHDLPPRDGATDSIDDLLTGVARWAQSLTRDRQEDFLVAWAGLSGRLGLTPADIQTRVAAILSAPALADKPFAGWWAAALGMAAVNRRVGNRSFPANSEGWKQATRDLKRQVQSVSGLSISLRGEIAEFIANSEAYADASMDLHGHSLNMNQLGTALLPIDPHLTLTMVQSSLERDPYNAHQYGLWARALMALKQGEAAVKVLWQGIALDPLNVHFRTQLAEAMARLSRAGEAEALYRETMCLFPNDAPCRNALAELLSKQGRVAEAEALYRETMRLPHNDDVCRNALARLLADQGREGEALPLYRETVSAFPNDPVCRLDLGLLLLRRGPDADGLAEVRRLLDDLRRMKHTAANTLTHHLDRHARGLPFLSRPGERGEEQQALTPGDLPEALLIAADAREVRFRLGGALDNPDLLLLTEAERARLKREAVERLNRLAQADPGHPLLLLLGRRYGGKVAGLAPGNDEDIRLEAASDPVLAIAARRFGLITPRDYEPVRTQWPSHAHLADAAELLDLGPGATVAAGRVAALVRDWQSKSDREREKVRPWDARLADEFLRLLVSRTLEIDAANLVALVRDNPDGLDELLDICLMASVEMLPERSLFLVPA